MTTNTPITEAGVTYNKLAVTLNITSIPQGSSLTTAVSLQLTPQGVNASGEIALLPDESKFVSFADIMNCGDPDTLVVCGKISEAIQEFINKKGL